jgi:hypothetical protein
MTQVSVIVYDQQSPRLAHQVSLPAGSHGG